MGMQNGGWQSAGARQVEDLSNIWTFSGGAPISRASLLAGASLVARIMAKARDVGRHHYWSERSLRLPITKRSASGAICGRHRHFHDAFAAP